MSSIVETSVECEPEYQDLYQMLNDVLRNGIQEEDNTPPNSTSCLTPEDDCCEKIGANDLFLDSYDVQTTDPEIGSDYMFADKLFAKEMNLFESYSHQEQLDECLSICTFGQSVCEPPNRANKTSKSLDSPLKLQYQRRHNQSNIIANLSILCCVLKNI